MTADRAYARLVAANPVEDPERYLAEIVDLERSLQALEAEVMADEMVTPQPTASERMRRPLVAAAAFIAALVLAVPLWLAAIGGEPDVVGDDPADVVATFFDRWNRGDIDAAVALVSPDVAVNGGLQDWFDLRGLMVFAAQFDGAMEVECRPVPEDEALSCDWAWRSMSAEALDAAGPQSAQFVVVDGSVTALSTPNYGLVEQALSSFARDSYAEGFSTSCAPDGDAPRSVYGFPFNARCGQFLAGLEAEFVASRDG